MILEIFVTAAGNDAAKAIRATAITASLGAVVGISVGISLSISVGVGRVGSVSYIVCFV
jgi:hypothetical protein